MDPFEVLFLGCGSAKPNSRHFPSCQVLSFRQKLFVIDCGEGAQIKMCENHVNFSRIHAVFLSHLHGDHCYGLPGLISTMNLLGRTSELHIYGPRGLEALFAPWVVSFNPEMSYRVVFHEFTGQQVQTLYSDRSLEVLALPLCHRVPCCGFLFRELPGLRHLRRGAREQYCIPISWIGRIKAGEDFISGEGERIPNGNLTLPADPVRSYAYLSDTLWKPELARMVGGVSLLYHEATFQVEDAPRALRTFHSTSCQAAQTALEAGAHRLVVGHFSSRYRDEAEILAQARSVFPETILAHEGLKLCVEP